MICAALTGERLDTLHLPQMVARNADSMRTAYTVTVDFRHGTSTGISAADRAATLRALVDPSAQAGDFNRPGHVFPLRAVPGGVLARRGHTKAAVNLTRLAGLSPGGVLVEIVNDDGSMARRPQLERFAKRHGLPLITIHDLTAWRRRKERIVDRVSTCRLPTRHGVFTLHGYREKVGGPEHVAMVMGEPDGVTDMLARVHSECLTGEVAAREHSGVRHRSAEPYPQRKGSRLHRLGRADLPAQYRSETELTVTVTPSHPTKVRSEPRDRV